MGLVTVSNWMSTPCPQHRVTSGRRDTGIISQNTSVQNYSHAWGHREEVGQEEEEEEEAAGEEHKSLVESLI